VHSWPYARTPSYHERVGALSDTELTGEPPAQLLSESDDVDLTDCDREPIHVPGSIQPHGLLLIADAASLRVAAGAGEIEERLAPDWVGRTLQDLLDQAADTAAAQARSLSGSILALDPVRGRGETFDASLHLVGEYVLVELEPRPDISTAPGASLSRLDAISTAFERAPDLVALCQRAATAFREVAFPRLPSSA